MNLNPYRLFIFDWDGTLINSHQKIMDSLEAAFHCYAIKPPVRDLLGSIIGLGIEFAMRRLYPEGDSEIIDRLSKAYREAYVVRDATPCVLFEGVEETLVSLKEKGCLLAIATGKSRVGLDRALNRTSLRSLFSLSRCADETLSKPHPLMIHETIQALKCSKAECVMVGDSVFDLEMARNAGIDAIAVTTGEYKKEQLSIYAPTLLLDKLSDLACFI